MILVVDDDAELRKMFRIALRVGGFDVHEAGDGYSALKWIDQHSPDAIVLDLGLPAMSGHVVLQELAAHAHTRSIPVIIVTGMPGDHERLNAACVLRKPVAPEHLVNT